MIEWLKGKKTYIGAALMVILSGLLAQGYIDQATFTWLAGIVGGLTAMAMGAKIDRKK